MAKKRKAIKPKVIATKMIKHDLRNTVFLLLPSFETLVPVHFDCNERKMLLQKYTVDHYRKVKLHWNVAIFVLTRNPIDGLTELECKNYMLLNGTYNEAGSQAFKDLEDWVEKINPKRRVNVGFAMTQRTGPITIDDCERWTLNDPDFGAYTDVITTKDEKRALEDQIRRLEAIA